MTMIFQDINVKLGNQAHQKIQLTIPTWKLENIDATAIDDKHNAKVAKPKPKSKKLNTMG